MKLKIFAGVLVSILFLYLSFQNMDFIKLWDAFLSANYYFFILAAAFSIIPLLLKTYRWQILMRPKKDIKFSKVYAANAICYFGNNILPLRAGEFLRAYIIGRDEKLSKSSILATILLERVLDILSLILVTAITFYILPISQSRFYTEIQAAGLSLLLFLLGMMTFIAFLIVKRDMTLTITNKILGILPDKISSRLTKFLNSFIDGLEVIKSKEQYFKLLISTILIWICGIIQFYIMLYAFDFNLGYIQGFNVALAAVIFAMFAQMIPLAPGNVGTTHFFILQALLLYGISDADGLAYAFLMHASGIIPITMIGFYYFLKANVKYAIIAEQKNKPDSETIIQD